MQILNVQSPAGIHAYSPLINDGSDTFAAACRKNERRCCWRLWQLAETLSDKLRSESEWMNLYGCFLLWFASSLICAQSSSEIVHAKMDASNTLNLVMLLGLSQSLWSFVFSVISSQILSHCSNYSKTCVVSNPKLFPWLWKLGLLYALGSTCVNQSLLVLTVPSAQTLRSLEAIICIILCALFLPNMAIRVQSFPLCILLPLITAGTLCLFFGNSLSFISASFSVYGVAMAANFAFAFKSVTYKKCQAEFSVDSMTVFHHVSKCSIAVNFCLFLAYDWKHLHSFMQLGEMLEGRMLFLLFVNGIAYFAAHRLSFLILHKLPVETHAVGVGLQQTLLAYFLLSPVHAWPTTIHSIGLVLAVAAFVLYVSKMNFEIECKSGAGSGLPHTISGAGAGTGDLALLQEQFTTQATTKDKVSPTALDVMTNSPLYGNDDGAPFVQTRIVSTGVGQFEMLM